jgi:hypothetical protein
VRKIVKDEVANYVQGGQGGQSKKASRA